MIDRLTNETVELLQALIRNQCVNDGTPESGQEESSARLLRDELEGTGVDLQLFETVPGRTSLVARYQGTDPTAPALCLMGHTDVVPVSPAGWKVDPFGGDLLTDADGTQEVWGRGAVDMLNLTSSMAVAFRHIVQAGKRYPGDIVYFAVADEEAGGVHGAKQLIEDEWDALKCDYLLTEYGGTPMIDDDRTIVLLTAAEKGAGAREITITGEPGHGSMPFGADNALIKAAEIVQRLSAYNPNPQLKGLFEGQVKALGLDAAAEKRLLDPAQVVDALSELPPSLAASLHSCCHMSFSPNRLLSGQKDNVIPDVAKLLVDIRILPGETQDDVDTHLRAAIGDELMASVQLRALYPDEVSTSSSTDTPLWHALADSILMAYPGAEVMPSLVTGGTDARFYRRRGVPSYGAGLLSSKIPLGEFMSRFHGHNERIDVDSLKLTTQLWLDVLDRFWVNVDS